MHNCAFEHNIYNNAEKLEIKIENDFFNMRDEKYRDFTASLIPTMDKQSIIGVRTPQIRAYGRTMGDAQHDKSAAHLFLQNEHRYYELDNLQAVIISSVKDVDYCIRLLNDFLPRVNNWATCDMLRPKVLGKNKSELYKKILQWLSSQHEYTVRFGIEMLMCHFLDEDFDKSHLSLVASVRCGEYYIDMMVAWYFATALAKQYEQSVRIIQNKELSPWRHNKAITKACESLRIDKDTKSYLKGLRIK